ncbi:helicase, partial [Sulfolobus sp. B5]
PFGSRGNNTLGTIFSVLLSSEKSVKTSFRADPYHIAVASILPINRYDIQRVIEKINSFNINELLEILKQGIKESPQFKWKLLVEIERFGMVDFDKKNIQITSPILKAYTNTLVGEEAVNELLVKNHDVEVINEIKKYSWKIVEVIEPSPLAREFLDKLMSYNTNDDAPLVIEVYKRKLINKEIKVICLVCGWSSKHTVVNTPDKCPKCNSIFLTATSPDDKDAERIIRDAMLGKRLKGNEKRKLEDLKTIASLFSSYGKHAFIALSANGIGPSNLGRV